jgi:hypothetical protein
MPYGKIYAVIRDGNSYGPFNCTTHFYNRFLTTVVEVYQMPMPFFPLLSFGSALANLPYVEGIVEVRLFFYRALDRWIHAFNICLKTYIVL